MRILLSLTHHPADHLEKVHSTFAPRPIVGPAKGVLRYSNIVVSQSSASNVAPLSAQFDIPRLICDQSLLSISEVDAEPFVTADRCDFVLLQHLDRIEMPAAKIELSNYFGVAFGNYVKGPSKDDVGKSSVLTLCISTRENRRRKSVGAKRFTSIVLLARSDCEMKAGVSSCKTMSQRSQTPGIVHHVAEPDIIVHLAPLTIAPQLPRAAALTSQAPPRER